MNNEYFLIYLINKFVYYVSKVIEFIKNFVYINLIKCLICLYMGSNIEYILIILKMYLILIFEIFGFEYCIRYSYLFVVCW